MPPHSSKLFKPLSGGWALCQGHFSLKVNISSPLCYSVLECQLEGKLCLGSGTGSASRVSAYREGFCGQPVGWYKKPGCIGDDRVRGRSYVC